FQDPRLKTNGQRVKERAWLIPRLNELTREHSQDELAAKLEAIGMPFAPIAKPWDLLDDPHLSARGGLLETRARAKTLRGPARPPRPATACRFAPTRRASASTRGNCSSRWAAHRRKATACATAV